MSEQRTESWLRAGGVEISDRMVLLELKLAGGGEFLAALLARKVAATLARREGLTVSPDEVDEAVAEFHAEQDLFEEEPIAAWRQERRLDEATIRAFVEEGLLAARYRDHVAPDEAVEQRFRSNLPDYARADADVFSFEAEGPAREFVLAVREGERDAGAGERRRLARGSAPEEVAAELFAARPGEWVGPVETDEGAFEVYRLIRRDEPRLDDALREQIRDEIFRAAIEREPAVFLS